MPPIFRILPLATKAEWGWTVETTHESGVVEKSVVFTTHAKAQAAADSWKDLDEDWDSVDPQDLHATKSVTFISND